MKNIRKRYIFALIIVSVLTVFNIKAQAMGSAPVAENLEISTFRNETVNGILTALDPEDDIAQFVLTTKPIKGEVIIEADGTFTYSPREGKKGRDYFGYKALDSEGNLSQEATVIIKINKP